MELQEYILEKIVKRREEIGMSRYELSKITGLSYNTLFNMEKSKDKRNISISNLGKILNALNMELNIYAKE